ncbi:MAG TPA: hypothetical protein P5534_05575 [Candidatus Paceibacterota bacterium]|nr:hypothetical protein [Candidatus Paceibacterota bacterium]
MHPIWEPRNSARKRHPVEHWLDPVLSVESGLRLEDRSYFDCSAPAQPPPAEEPTAEAMPANAPLVLQDALVPYRIVSHREYPHRLAA